MEYFHNAANSLTTQGTCEIYREELNCITIMWCVCVCAWCVHVHCTYMYAYMYNMYVCTHLPWCGQLLGWDSLCL